MIKKPTRIPTVGEEYVTIDNSGFLKVKMYNQEKQIVTYLQDGYQHSVRLPGFKRKIAKREYQKK